MQAAEVLIRHAPKNMQSILEPSVGQGDLLTPILNKYKKNLEKVVVVDTNLESLNNVKKKFKNFLGSSLKTVNADFLKWSQSKSIYLKDGFDCAIMNPPFLGTKKNWVKITPPQENNYNFAPLEIAFLLNTLKHLKPEGTLLGVFPASLISSMRMKWVRSILIQNGYVKYVHELPHFTFEKVEARVYLFVYQKTSLQKNIVLSNHDLLHSKKLIVNSKELKREQRFDYSYYNSKKRIQGLECKHSNLNWIELEHLACILRGSKASPEGKHIAIHTNHYKMGFWNSKRVLFSDKSEKGIQKGDFLIKRVGRDCSQSLGLILGPTGKACSDCILIIRPRNPKFQIKLLFAIRVMFSLEEVKGLLENGTGASYLTEHKLKKLKIPLNLSHQYKEIYCNYKRAVLNQNIDNMKKQEGKIKSLFK